MAEHPVGHFATERCGHVHGSAPDIALATVVSDVPKAILATVAYYDVFERPLTASEIAQRLIGRSASEEAVLAELTASTHLRQAITCADGYYALAWRASLIPQYQARAGARAQKWRRIQGFGRVACHVPFVRALIVGGSLAIGSARRQSDLDVCVLVAEGRLWIARACLWALRFLWNVSRRRPLETPKQDKLDMLSTYAPPAFVCHNQSIYAAMLLRDGLVLYEEDAIVGRYAAANDWVLAYCPGFTRLAPAPTVVRPPRVTLSLKRVVERFLALPLFDPAERTVFHWWRHRWERFAAATDRPSRRIIATLHAADLYSYYWQDQVLGQYREHLAGLGLLSPTDCPDW